jgi:peptidyl-prolyl cis-trans isomerase-like 4
MLDSGRIGADEDIDDAQGKTMEEMEEVIQEKEAKARATILEMIGDLPDAEIAPPENVLFVCKLNPVTSDDDLEIIFSRFGRVKSCEVIRDQKSKESLQYAFIEFEDRKACEDAYFKMDNVLIDDRRIHVDFSQSVAKYKWKGKGRGVQVDEKEPPPATSKKQAPWIIGSAGISTGSGNKQSESSGRKDWSRSPPRYSRGHASEQNKRRKKDY